MADYSRTCEYIHKWDRVRQRVSEFCGKPTTHIYPAQGGGFMALCEEHAKPHLSYATDVRTPEAPDAR